MGEKGNVTDMVSELRAMASQQPSGVRDQIMRFLADYQQAHDAVTAMTEDVHTLTKTTTAETAVDGTAAAPPDADTTGAGDSTTS